MLHVYRDYGRTRHVALTLQTVGVQQLLALLVALDPAFRASHALPGDAPQQALALVAVRRRCSRPRDEVMRRGWRYRVDQRLQRFFVHVHFLNNKILYSAVPGWRGNRFDRGGPDPDSSGDGVSETWRVVGRFRCPRWTGRSRDIVFWELFEKRTRKRTTSPNGSKRAEIKIAIFSSGSAEEQFCPFEITTTRVPDQSGIMYERPVLGTYRVSVPSGGGYLEGADRVKFCGAKTDSGEIDKVWDSGVQKSGLHSAWNSRVRTRDRERKRRITARDHRLWSVSKLFVFGPLPARAR